MLTMALDEKGIQDAGEAVFKYIMKDDMKDGQIQNCIHKMQEENLWEYYSEIDLHSKMFNVSWMLHQTFKGTYTKPDCLEITLDVSGTPEALSFLKVNLNKGNLLRLIASGLDEHFIINRLYADQLKGDRFEDAEGIVWDLSIKEGAESLQINFISSQYWMKEMEDVQSLTASLKA
jgi:hypothetical protein